MYQSSIHSKNKVHEFGGAIASYKNNMLYYNLPQWFLSPPFIFKENGEQFCQIKRKGNVWTGTNNSFYIFDENRKKLNCIYFDDLKMADNKIFEEDIICMSNICPETNTIFV